MNITKGFSAQSTVIVTEQHTAATLGSGDMAVFATPAMIALMENAAMKAIAPTLPEGSTSVGTEMSATHSKASAVGAEITATATVTEVEGRKITFTVSAHEGETLIGEGTHTRFVVDREKFMGKLNGN